MIAIYVLEVGGEIRYVGQTRKSLAERLSQHLRPSALKLRCHRTHWIKCLLSLGVRPRIQLVQFVPMEYGNEAERFWVSHFKERGCRLVNGTNGGDTGSYRKGRRVSQETRNKIRKARLGVPRSSETIRKISEALKGRRLNPDRLEAVRVAAARRRGLPGTPRTPSQRAKASEGLTSLWRNPEYRSLMVEAAVRSRGRAFADQYGKIYRCRREAAEALGVTCASVGDALKGRHAHCRGFFFRYLDEPSH